MILAGGQANYTVIVKTAEAEARQNKTDVEAEVMAQLQLQLGLIGNSLVDYQQYASIPDLENSTILYGFDEIGSQMLLPQTSPNGAFR